MPNTGTAHPRPLLLAGPTAVGKSEIALVLAEQLGGEIISVDSMQVYRGLDIGTAKPSPEERRRVRHHLIDVAGLTETFDAAQFVRLARAAVADIQARGRVPILCGGTGLYFRAFLEGLGQVPPADTGLRTRLEATPLPELLLELEQRDPATFAKIDRQNPRRVVRAVEVIRLTGGPLSAQRAPWVPARSARKSGEGGKIKTPLTPSLSPSDGERVAGGRVRGINDPIGSGGPVETLPPQSTPSFFGLARESEDLRARIDARVEAMFRNGLVGETEELLKLGLEENRTAMQAIGYRQVVEHLRGARGLPETIELVKIRTRQFARRQMTWFRRQAQLTWLRLSPQDHAEETAWQICEQLKPGA